jgi:hypothetical protein
MIIFLTLLPLPVFAQSFKEQVCLKNQHWFERISEEPIFEGTESMCRNPMWRHIAKLILRRMLFVQKASFTVDPQNKLVMTALWKPSAGDPFSHPKDTLHYFKDAHFKTRPIGWIARHAYSDEVDYFDDLKGLRISVRTYTQSVSSISFSPPATAIRAPTQKKL